MSRGKGFLIAAAIGIGAVALAAVLVSLAPDAVQHDPPSRVPFVETAAPVRGSGPIPVQAAGTVRPSAEVGIAPEVGGRVVEVGASFASGRRVAEGELLLRIEAADYEARLKEAQAALAARHVAFLQAQEEAASARAEYARFEGHAEGAAVPPARPLALHEPQLQAAQAALDRDEARVAAARRAVQRTEVRAPFDGFVREESVDAGQFVAAGQQVGRLFAAAAVEVVVPLSDTDAALIPRLWAGAGDDGAGVRVIATYGSARYAWRGQVDRAEAALDEQTRTIDAIIRVPEPFQPGTPLDSPRPPGDAPPLLVGKFVTVQIEGLAPTSYFRIPRAALQPGNEVWAVGPGGRVSIVPASLLQRGDDEVFVTAALAPEQRVVTAGLQFATDGMVVRMDEE